MCCSRFVWSVCAALAVLGGCTIARSGAPEAFGNLGAAVNSAYDDYAPALSDSSTLVFTSNRPERGAASLRQLDRSERANMLYYSMRLGAAWDNAQRYLLLIDNPIPCATVSFAPPGSAFGIVAYVSARQAGWDIHAVTTSASAMVNLGPDVNSPGWDAQPCVSADGSRLYFASDREGGVGGSDIWYCERGVGGAWGPARNAGAAINTAADEVSPFLHAGALYFASATPDAGLDIFVVNGGGSTRDRLPAPYNSTADDITPFIVGETMYLASKRDGGLGGLDLYAFPVIADP